MEKNAKEKENVPQEQPQRSQKLSYDDLQHVAGELSQQNQRMAQQLKQQADYIAGLQTQNVFSYLNFLFKVVENQVSFDEEFVSKCIAKTQTILTDIGELVRPENEENADGRSPQTE